MNSDMPNGAGTLRVTGQAGIRGDGPFMDITLVVSGQQTDSMVVDECRYETYGCHWVNKCGEWVSRWATGRTVDSLDVLDIEDLSQVLGGLPLGKEHCATLTVTALREARRHALDQVQGHADSQDNPQ